MGKLTLNNLQELNCLTNELEYNQASRIYLKLRGVMRDYTCYDELKKHISKLCCDYQEEHWGDEEFITDEQIEESDLAEKIVEAEQVLSYDLEMLICQSLKDKNLTTKDLADMLNCGELTVIEKLHGFCPFSRDDFVVLQQLIK